MQSLLLKIFYQERKVWTSEKKGASERLGAVKATESVTENRPLMHSIRQGENAKLKV